MNIEDILKADKLQLIAYAKTFLMEKIPAGMNQTEWKPIIQLFTKRLSNNNLYFYSREIYYKYYFDQIPPQVLDEKAIQKFSLYIYKDTALSSNFKFKYALKWLEKINLKASTQCETLGIAGSIFKRKWYYTSDLSNLYIAKLFYDAGHNVWLTLLKSNHSIQQYHDANDFGYCTINLCFVLDLLAYNRLKDNNGFQNQSSSIARYLTDSSTYRTLLVDTLANPSQTDIHQSILSQNSNEKVQFEKQYPDLHNMADEVHDISFVYATLIEAYLGLDNYAKAKLFIDLYNKLKVPNWQKTTFIEQLKELYKVKQKLEPFLNAETGISYAPQFSATDFEDCLGLILKKSSGAALPSFEGKVGIALSGGGFRAAYFHIGVLAALAENDKLKNIEVISCVSGGSIIGAYYFLELKKLFEKEDDSIISKNHYIEILENILINFHQDVGRNVRMNIFSNLWVNLKIMFSSSYSRSLRVAELYDEYFYNKYSTDILSLTNHKPISIHSTTIMPKGVPFNPRVDNFERVNKVPQLILNTTNLNSGHNFQFTSTWMGESPFSINNTIDAKARYRRMYYSESSTKAYKEFPLSKAVGASSCVPAMFPAIELENLYQDKKVSLVDGGVCDNQGLSAIVENECKILYISDASGQIQSNEFLIRNLMGESYRSTSVASERIREIQLSNALNKADDGFFDAFYLVHLKKDINEKDIVWTGNTESSGRMFAEDSNEIYTTYGIDTKIQKSLAEIRTDLDSFTDVEAYALMYCGYKQMIGALKTTDKSVNDTLPWKFKDIEAPLKDHTPRLLSELQIGSKLPFKWFFLSKLKSKGFMNVKWMGIAIGTILLSLMAYYVWSANICFQKLVNTILNIIGSPWEFKIPRFAKVFVWVKVFVVFILFDTFLWNRITNNKYRKWGIAKLIYKPVVALLLFLIFNLHLKTTDKLFLKLGKLDK